MADRTGEGPPREQESRMLTKLIETLYRLASVRVLLGTLVLFLIALTLIVIGAVQPPSRQQTTWNAVLLQLGTGLLVSAVGAALIQLLAIRARNDLQRDLNELRAGELKSITQNLSTSLETFSSKIDDIQVFVQDTKNREAGSSLKALDEKQISVVHATRDRARQAIFASLEEPSVTDIRLLGLSLNDFVRSSGSRSFNRTWDGIESRIRSKGTFAKDSGSLAVRALLVDPHSAGAHLLAGGVITDGGAERLARVRHNVMFVADHLARLQEESSRTPHISFEFRFYRIPPHAFMCSTNSVTYVQWYHLCFGRTLAAGPVFQFRPEASMHKAMQEHFDLIWELASVSPEEVMRERLRGVEAGVYESGITEVYTDPRRTRERIISLLKHAKKRVWMQGVSLSTLRTPGLDRAFEELVQRGSVKVRLLLLDPDSEQAYLKTYREYAHTLGDQFSETWQDYRRKRGLHRDSTLYSNIREAVDWFARFVESTPSDNFEVRLYRSAPAAFVMLVDDLALVEQYHYGKFRGAESARVRLVAPLQLAEDMAVVEYHHPHPRLFQRIESFDPLAVFEDHFDFVFQRFGIPVSGRTTRR